MHVCVGLAGTCSAPGASSAPAASPVLVCRRVHVHEHEHVCMRLCVGLAGTCSAPGASSAPAASPVPVLCECVKGGMPLCAHDYVDFYFTRTC